MASTLQRNGIKTFLINPQRSRFGSSYLNRTRPDGVQTAGRQMEHILSIACAENLSHPSLLRRKDSGFA